MPQAERQGRLREMVTQGMQAGLKYPELKAKVLNDLLQRRAGAGSATAAAKAPGGAGGGGGGGGGGPMDIGAANADVAAANADSNDFRPDRRDFHRRVDPGTSRPA